jgi:hypothetical protein
VVAPERAHFPLDATLLVPLARRAELGGEAVVRPEGDEPRRLLPPEAPQDLLHRRREVVVPQPAVDPAQEAEGVLVRLQKGLLRRPQVRPVERGATGHAPEREHLQRQLLAVHLRHCLIPVDLRLLAPGVLLRDAQLWASAQSQAPLCLAHVAAHRRLRNGMRGLFLSHPHPDAVRRMPLLAGRPPICFQDVVDERRDRRRPRPQARPGRVRLRYRTVECLPHEPPMHPKLAGDAGHRADAKLVLPPDLFEQFHRRPPSSHAASRRPMLVATVGDCCPEGGPFPTIELGHSRVAKSLFG